MQNQDWNNALDYLMVFFAVIIFFELFYSSSRSSRDKTCDQA